MRVQDFCILVCINEFTLQYEMPLYPLHYFYNTIFWTKHKTEEPAVFIDSNLQEMQLNISTQ
jgi:hypothetical protein